MRPIEVGEGATSELAAAVYEELRCLAYRTMCRESAPTLQPTALVHEAYLRLSAERTHGWANRAQFFRAAATAMRRILVERARRRNALRREGAARRIELDLGLLQPSVQAPGTDLLELDLALEDMRGFDPHLFELVELRVFGGLTVVETAAVLGSSERSVRRGWETARMFLFERIQRLRASGGRAGAP